MATSLATPYFPSHLPETPDLKLVGNTSPIWATSKDLSFFCLTTRIVGTTASRSMSCSSVCVAKHQRFELCNMSYASLWWLWCYEPGTGRLEDRWSICLVITRWEILWQWMCLWGTWNSDIFIFAGLYMLDGGSVWLLRDYWRSVTQPKGALRWAWQVMNMQGDWRYVANPVWPCELERCFLGKVGDPNRQHWTAFQHLFFVMGQVPDKLLLVKLW